MCALDQHVIFTLDDQRYTLPLSNVDRVVLAVYVTPLPKAPDIVAGIISVQGQVIPVINLRRRFRLSERSIEPTDQFIIVHTSRRTVALTVDTVIGVVTIPQQTLVHREDFLPSIEHVAGAIQQEDGVILIHDLEACLSFAEEHALDIALQAA